MLKITFVMNLKIQYEIVSLYDKVLLVLPIYLKNLFKTFRLFKTLNNKIKLQFCFALYEIVNDVLKRIKSF